MDNLEYKVITSNVPSFAAREKLQKILEEESRAGWDLMEKLDNYKIRLARDKSARDNDAGCTIDPYRTTVGINNWIYLGGAALATIIVVLIVIRLAAMAA